MWRKRTTGFMHRSLMATVVCKVLSAWLRSNLKKCGSTTRIQAEGGPTTYFWVARGRKSSNHKTVCVIRLCASGLHRWPASAPGTEAGEGPQPPSLCHRRPHLSFCLPAKHCPFLLRNCHWSWSVKSPRPWCSMHPGWRVSPARPQPGWGPCRPSQGAAVSQPHLIPAQLWGPPSASWVCTLASPPKTDWRKRKASDLPLLCLKT